MKYGKLERPTLLKLEIEKINEKLAIANDNYDALVKAGLRKSQSAKELLTKINEWRAERDRLIEKDVDERHDLAAYMLLCFVGADFACETANLFERKLKHIYGNIASAENDLISALQNCAKRFEQIVVAIDATKSERLALSFADMSDEITDLLLESNIATAKDILKRHFDVDGGKNFSLNGKKK